MRRGVPRRRLTPSPDPQAQLVKPTLAKAAFFSIKFGAFAEALGYLKAANVDPRAVLALFPSVIPASVDAATVQSHRRSLLETYGMDTIDDVGACIRKRALARTAGGGGRRTRR